MRKMLAVVGVTAFLVVAGLGSPTPGYTQADPTKAKAKAATRQAGQAAQTKWQSLSPETQQRIIQEAKVDYQVAMKKWDSMTPQQQQQALQKAKAGGGRLMQWWKNLPPGGTK